MLSFSGLRTHSRLAQEFTRLREKNPGLSYQHVRFLKQP